MAKKETKQEKKAADLATRKRLGLRGLPKDIYQSFAFTVSRYKWSIYEKRIVYRLIEMAQCELEGIRFSDGLHNIEPNKLMKLHEITMPVKDILANEEDKHYTQAKAAFKSLSKKGCEYENDEIWSYVNIIAHPTINKGSGLVKFTVFDEFWKLLLKFGSDPKGYRKIELLTAMSFDSVYSMRIYELISGQTRPMTWDLAFITDRFQLTKRMSSPPILEERVLAPAKKELDEKAPYSFKYERIEVKSRGRGGKKVTGYTITPYPIQKNRNNVLEMKDITAKLPSGGRFGGLLKTELYDLLTKEFGWPKDSVNSNKTLFMRAEKELQLPDLIDTLRRFYGLGRTANNPIAYVIHCLQEELTNRNPK